MTTGHDPLARWLDGEMRAFLDRSASFYPLEANTADIGEVRRLYARLTEGFRAPRPAGVAVEDGVAGGVPGGVRVRRYRPAGGAAAVLLYAHGGGFILGGLESHDDVCAELCAGAGVEVVSVDYRLAPEHVYPAALDDLEAAWRAVAAEGRRTLVGGDSAGGHLAASLCRRLARLGAAQPAGQVLIYPGLSFDAEKLGHGRAANAPGLTAADCAYYARVYAGGEDRLPTGDPEFSPLDAEDFSGIAPAAVFAAGYDPLRQDAEDYAALLHAAGVAVTYRCDPGLIHGWLRARHMSGLAGRAFAAVVAATRGLADGV